MRNCYPVETILQSRTYNFLTDFLRTFYVPGVSPEYVRLTSALRALAAVIIVILLSSLLCRCAAYNFLWQCAIGGQLSSSAKWGRYLDEEVAHWPASSPLISFEADLHRATRTETTRDDSENTPSENKDFRSCEHPHV
jgi:hypothetical protein